MGLFGSAPFVFADCRLREGTRASSGRGSGRDARWTAAGDGGATESGIMESEYEFDFKGNIKGDVKSDGQECPSHTGKSKSKASLRSATWALRQSSGQAETRSHTTWSYAIRFHSCFAEQAVWGVGGNDVYG